jgi:hypothetical protein
MRISMKTRLPYVSSGIAIFVAAALALDSHTVPTKGDGDRDAVAAVTAVPTANAAAPTASATSLGPTWGMVGYAPGHIAAVPQPFGFDTVVAGRTTKKIFLSFGAQPDVSTAASIFYTAVSDDSGQRFLTSEKTPWTALNMVRLNDGSLMSIEFIPDWVDSTHAHIRTWRSSDMGKTWQLTRGLYTSPEAMGFLRVWRGPIQLASDGSVIVPAYTKYAGDRRNRSMILQTKDFGASWTLRSTIIPPTPDLGTNEVGMSYTTDGRLLAVVRPDTPEPYQLRMAYSADDGLTWSPPDVVRGPAGPVGSVSPVLALQPNGMLLLGYGRPDNNLLVSSDGTGRTWDSHAFVFGNAPATTGPARDQGSSGNTAITNVEANRSIFFYDRCHSNNLCKPYNEQYSIWGTYVDAVTPGDGKIDVATKLLSRSATLSGQFGPGRPEFPETRPEGAFDGSSSPHAASILHSSDKTIAPSMVVKLDQPYALNRIGLMLGNGESLTANVSLSVDGNTYSSPVVTATGTRDRALRYTDFPAQRAQYVKVSAPAGTATPVTELELYAADVSTFENEPVFDVPRGFTDATNATTTDVDLGGSDSRRSLRLFDNYIDQVAKITKVTTDRPRQITTFDLGSSEWNYRGQFVFDVKGHSGTSLTTRWHFMLTPGSYPAPGTSGTPGVATLSVYDGTSWSSIGTLSSPIRPQAWRSVKVDATLSTATVTINGQSFTTNKVNQAADYLSGMSFTSAGTDTTATTWFVDDVSVTAG